MQNVFEKQGGWGGVRWLQIEFFVFSLLMTGKAVRYSENDLPVEKSATITEYEWKDCHQINLILHNTVHSLSGEFWKLAGFQAMF